jgi:hypothetical protein
MDLRGVRLENAIVVGVGNALWDKTSKYLQGSRRLQRNSQNGIAVGVSDRSHFV